MPPAIAFGPYELELRGRQLSKSGLRIKLRSQSIEILAALLESPGQLITREELQARLWPDVHYADFENGLNSAVNRLREALSDPARESRYIETIPGRGYRFIGAVSSRPKSGGKVRLAVLPFENLSGDPAQEYLSDGVTEELITTLAGLDPNRLGVVARTTAMHYKGTSKSVAAISRELNVDYIVEGSFRRERDRARVTAQLIRADDETHVWGRSYDEELRSFLGFQEKVAHAVAGEIESNVPAAKRRNVDPAAWECWIKGLYHTNRHDHAGLESAVSYFQQALDLDPSFARCWARLATIWCAQTFWAFRPPAETYPKAKVAAMRALDLDDTIAEAHYALGNVLWNLDWDLADAERHFERALALGPNDPAALVFAGAFVASMESDFVRGVAEAERAVELDPLSVLTCAWAAWPNYWGRRYDRAIALSRRALDMDRNCLMARYVLGVATSANGSFDESIAILKETHEKHQDAYSLAYLGMAFGRAGMRDRALEVLGRMKDHARREFLPPTCFAWVWAALGEKQRALDCLDRALAEHDVLVLWARASPSYDALRSEPRYYDFLRRLPLLPERSVSGRT
jgi:TolB-like protein